EKMFDTTGESNAGYGGARNMAFLLGPVIAQTLREGGNISGITPQNLLDSIRESALSRDAPKLYMGDDTEYQHPRSLCSKIGANVLYGDEYSAVTSKRDGRVTTGVEVDWARFRRPGQIENAFNERSQLFTPGTWDAMHKYPMMGSILTSPRFCFDIP